MNRVPALLITLATLLAACTAAPGGQDTVGAAVTNTAGHAATLTATAAIAAGFDNLYAVETSSDGSNLAWMGGWATAEDAARGDDRLYQGVYDGTAIRNLTPLHFDNPGYAEGYVAGYHANDPSVIYLADRGWHFMYYTALNDAYGTDSAQMMRRNWVGFAASSDGGASWHDSGVILGQWNGFDGSGAWAPSAVDLDDEIWLYYNTGAQNCTDAACSGPGLDAPKVLRTRLSPNGWQFLATDPLVGPDGGQIHLVNVDVSHAFGQYWMVANFALSQIVLYTSDDGIHFVPYDGNIGLLADGGAYGLFTPHIRVTSPTTFDVFFSLGQGSGGAHSSHRWSFAL
jgi:hypothetical protein